MSIIKIAIVDDQLLFRKGIISLLSEYDELAVVFEACDGAELLSKLEKRKVDVVLLDLEMPVLNGIDTTKLLKQKFPEVKIVILTMHNDEGFVLELVKCGAHGFLLKDNDIEIVVDAIYAVIDTGFYFNPSISKKLVASLMSNKTEVPAFNGARFTEQELKVIEYVCKDNSNKKIAENMAVSVRTVDGYIENIYKKAGVRGRAGLVMFAVKHKLISKSLEL